MSYDIKSNTLLNFLFLYLQIYDRIKKDVKFKGEKR